MIAKLVIPVVNTENINCESNINLSREEFGDMVYDTFRKNDKAIDAYTRGRISRSAYYNPYASEDEYDTKHVKDTVFNEVECECQIMNVKKGEINDDWLREYVYNGKMFLLIFNINPSEMESSVETEIRFWRNDSELILNDEKIDDDMAKLRLLPTRTFKLRTDEQEYTINNCKLIENRSDEKFPYCFVIIIEKIY